MSNPSEFDKVQRFARAQQEREEQITRGLMLSGKRIIELGLVQNLQDQKEQIQPAGVDFTLKQLATFASPGVIDLDNTRRVLPGYNAIEFDDDMVNLLQGVYLVEFNETVSLPNNVIGLMRTRSSVFRSGAVLTAGVIDPGYSGAVGALLQIGSEHGISLTRNAKLAQWVFAEVGDPPEEGYSGVYKDAKRMF